MLKKSVILVFVVSFISCFYFISCKSSSVDSFVYLVINNEGLDSNVEPYLTKIRIVANSSNGACAANKKVVTLGAPTDEAGIDGSFNVEGNFVGINSSNAMKLDPACLPYRINLGYWCKGGSDLEKYPSALCYKSNPPVDATVNDIVVNKGSKLLKLTFTLERQGNWTIPTSPSDSTTDDSTTPPNNFNMDSSTNPDDLVSVNISTSIEKTPITLATLFGNACFIKNDNIYDFVTFDDKIYLLFSKNCTYESIKQFTDDSQFSTKSSDDFNSPFSNRSEFIRYTNNLIKGNNILELLEINGKTPDINMGNDGLKKALETKITSGFKINIITIPDTYKQDDSFKKQTIIFKN